VKEGKGGWLGRTSKRCLTRIGTGESGGATSGEDAARCKLKKREKKNIQEKATLGGVCVAASEKKKTSGDFGNGGRPIVIGIGEGG